MKGYTIIYEVSTSSGLNVWKDLIASVESFCGLKRIVNELMCLLLQDEALRLSRYLGAGI